MKNVCYIYPRSLSKQYKSNLFITLQQTEHGCVVNPLKSFSSFSPHSTVVVVVAGSVTYSFHSDGWHLVFSIHSNLRITDMRSDSGYVAIFGKTILDFRCVHPCADLAVSFPLL